ncbi:MAG: virB8 family protein, partial [Aestuariivirga sp.]
ILTMPLKTYEPYLIAVDRSTGFLEVKRSLAEGPLSQDESVTMFNVVRFIRARETYDPKALKDNFDLAQLLATGDAARELTELFSPANPANPIRQLGLNTIVAVTIKSVTFPNYRTALVRFATEEKSAAKIETRHYVGLVRFRYTGAPMRNEFRFENPLGFQVTEYRRDQETVPMPPAVQPQSSSPAMPPSTSGPGGG